MHLRQQWPSTNNRLIHDLEDLVGVFYQNYRNWRLTRNLPIPAAMFAGFQSLTMTIAEKINESKEGPYAGIHFDEDKLKELRISAWLHDVGKITTPEFIIDKGKKLETIYDRVEIVKGTF